MDVGSSILKVDNMNLLEHEASESSRFEYLTELWEAAENFVSPEIRERWMGFDWLLNHHLLFKSPLIVYILISRLNEPELDLRVRIVHHVADLIDLNYNLQFEKEYVQKQLIMQLSAMRNRQIFSLLQVVDYDPDLEPQVTKILNYCSYAGTHLSGILSDRLAPNAIRKLAAYFIGKVGYLDALPTMERMVTRLETRTNGTNGHKSHEITENEQTDLLQTINRSLEYLTAL